jgi:serine/threonine-protein kinase
MNEPPPPDPTVDAVPDDLLDAGLAALFGPDQPPSSGRGGRLREPEPGSPELPAGTAGRYEVQREIARGGMGAVLQGRDMDLQRDVALKVLLEADQARAELRQRFVEEAQIAGQLQHPGVAPVYELGTFADGRPFFSMKLVKGRTLAALLGERNEPAEDLPRLLGIFLQVCQTLAYAHARGVIHRDLKPANVMVGAFGEVQVMDWGLAKVLARGGSAGEPKAQQPQAASVIRTQRSSSSDTPADSQTQAGSVLGTPTYMAPEQARGEVDLVDARADVFGLGALLCEIVTGRPPFVGPTAEAMRKAQAAKLEDAYIRLDGCGADARLAGLARRCLAAEPWDRPRDASAVAAEVTAYQESVIQCLRQAELACAAEAARAEEAKATAEQERQARQQAQARAAAERRARKLTVALAGSLLLTFLLGGGGWLWLAHAAAERKRQELERQAQVTAEVHAALERAAALRAQAVADPAKAAEARAFAKRAEALTENGAVAPELVGRVRALLGELDEGEADRRLLAAVDAARLRRAELNVKQMRFATELALPAYAAAFRSYGLTAGATDPTEAAARVRRRPAAVRDRLVAALDDWAALAACYAAPERDWVRRVAAAADPDPWRGRLRAARAAGDRPALEQLARELDVARQPPTTCAGLDEALTAVGSHEVAVEVLQRAQQCHPGDFWINHGLAWQLLQLNRVAEAVRFFTVALALRPDNPAVHVDLGVALHEDGDYEGAVAAYRRAIDLQPGYAAAHNNLGHTLNARGQLEEAVQEFRAALALDPNLAAPHVGLGNVLYAKEQTQEAIREFRAALALDPKEARAHSGLGAALYLDGKLDEAIREQRAAIALNPKLPEPYNNLGAVYLTRRQWDEAIREYRAAIALKPRYVTAHKGLGNALRGKGQLDEAIRELRAAVALDPKVATTHFDLGHALLDQGKWDEAVREFREVIALDPKMAKAHGSLGQVLGAQGRLAEAREATRRCLALLPPGHRKRPQASLQLRKIERALALDQKLPAILKGEAKPAGDTERLELAWLCQQPFKKLNAASSRFYAEAFAHDHRLAGDLRAEYRYHAARAAALAGAGLGRDDPPPGDTARVELRRQARAWLRADLRSYASFPLPKEVRARGVIQQRLRRWQADLDLAGLRDEAALSHLTEEERQACRRLWADVDALLQKARDPE